MKPCPIVLCLVLATAIAAAQSPDAAPVAPKLALAPIEIPGPLLKKFETEHSSQSAVQPAPAAHDEFMAWQGAWSGVARQGRETSPLLLRLVVLSDGARLASLENQRTHRAWRARSITGKGTTYKIVFDRSGKFWGGELDGALDPGTDRLALEWRRGGNKKSPVLFSRLGSSDRAPGSNALALGSRLDEMAHALSVQLHDRLGGMGTFTVMDEGDVIESLPGGTATDQIYNLKNRESVQHLQKAEIRFIVFPALEDYENQTIDLAQGRVAYVNEADKHGSQSQVTKQAGAQRNRNQTQGYHAAQRTGSSSNALSVSTGSFDPHVKKSQNVHATLRCRLVEVGTGKALGSVICSFATNRAYVAAANGNNMMDTGELVHAVAGMLAQNTGLQLTDLVYPIRILEKANQEVTIGRGSAGGIQVGQVYDAFMVGKDIKDPATGAILGQDELKVGKVSISELHPKFCKARILDDNGIVPGATLRRSR